MPSMTANDSSEAVDTVVKFDFLKDKKFNVYVTGVWNCHLPVCGGGSTGADTVFWEQVYAFVIC